MAFFWALDLSQSGPLGKPTGRLIHTHVSFFRQYKHLFISSIPSYLTITKSPLSLSLFHTLTFSVLLFSLLSPSWNNRVGRKKRVSKMRPKDGFFIKGPYKGGFFLMHVASSSSKCKVAMSMTMVNDPLRRIGRCDQKKEAISGSEIGADNSPAAGAASSF
ncbi:hypothetical protein HKD37_09G024300 [Glycine soja]